jgi:hypothetical protein
MLAGHQLWLPTSGRLRVASADDRAIVLTLARERDVSPAVCANFTDFAHGVSL